jgi:DNA-binding transcriptional LysR family regulator
VRSFVRAGLCVAAVPLLAYTPTPGIRAVRSPSLGVRRHVSVLSSQRRTNPAIDGMIRALSAAAASVSATW